LTGLAPKKTQNGANLYVIRTNEKPAVLVETASISNASDLSYLMSTSGQKTIAEAIVKGIIKTLGEI
ncbi:MAG: N-acetylmuramoyl-L-alanine amidase, partial [Clostridia bacterium]|nr:N-acetylmuramoyl-L-alanine amidase [Clostridia bacterium]